MKDMASDEPSLLPINLGGVLMSDDYRQYGVGGSPDRHCHYEIFKCFVKNVLSCVDYELTDSLSKKVHQMGYNDYISRTFTALDEAYAILLVLNYESRWKNMVIHPTKDRKRLDNEELPKQLLSLMSTPVVRISICSNVVWNSNPC